MAVYAVIPVKNLAVSKRRLSAVFTPQERSQLTLAMIEDVLHALQSSMVDETVVVGEDSQVQRVAEKLGATYLSATEAGLNPAIEEATSWCMQRGAASVLVLPADIPLLTSKDVNRLLELGAGGGTVVLSPSQNGGTNALLRSPPKLIPACFGPKSFIKHMKEAYAKGVNVKLYYSAGTALDVDSAEDLKKLSEIENTTNSRRILEQIRLKSK
jgi:2-phospho-L-lactate guanylyltransferase